MPDELNEVQEQDVAEQIAETPADLEAGMEMELSPPTAAESAAPEPAEALTSAQVEVQQAKRVIEGILFVSDHPVPVKRLRTAVQGLDVQTVRQLLDELNIEYLQSGRAFRIQEIAGGFQIVTDPQLAPLIKKALELPRQDTVSKAALETLAITAYRQPLSKADIETIRGVDGGATIETLLERQFIKIVGRKETPGRPLLYGTADEFMRHFGLKSLSDLPSIGAAGQLPDLDAANATPAPSAEAASASSTASAAPDMSESSSIAESSDEPAAPAASEAANTTESSSDPTTGSSEEQERGDARAVAQAD